MTVTTIVLRLGLAASRVVSAVSHTYLYIHGYQHIPMIGTAFLVQASISFAVAVLIVARGPDWLCWCGAALAGGSLVGFVLSRSAGLAGFSEQGWNPAPHAAISVSAEILTVALWAVLQAAPRYLDRRAPTGAERAGARR